MIVQESTRGMTQVTGSEKVPMTPTTPTARRQDLDQERPLTERARNPVLDDVTGIAVLRA